MNTNNVTTGESLHWIVWYKSLNVYDKAEAKKTIIKRCLIRNEQTFKNWLYSYIAVDDFYHPIIAKIAKQPLDFTFEPRASSYHTRKLLNS